MTAANQKTNRSGAKASGASASEYYVPSGMVYGATMFLKEVVLAAMNAYRNHNLKFFEMHGIDRALVADIMSLDTWHIDELCRNHAHLLLKNNPGGMPLQNLDVNRFLQNQKQHIEDERMYRQYLVAGASNTLVADFFGKRASECAVTRSELGIKTCCGRKNEPKYPGVKDEVYSAYLEQMKELRDPRKAYLAVRDGTGHALDFIHKTVNYWEDLRDR